MDVKGLKDRRAELNAAALPEIAAKSCNIVKYHRHNPDSAFGP